MDITNKVSISSLDSKILTPEQTQQIKTDQQSSQIVDLSLSIDDKFTDDVSLKKNQTIDAIILKNENGKQTISLENGKLIEVELPKELNVKVLDKLSIQIVDSKVVDIQVKDLATQVNLNKTDLIKLVQSLELKEGLKQIIAEKLNIDISSLNPNDKSVKVNMLNLLSIKAKPEHPLVDFIKAINEIKKIDPTALAKIDLGRLNIIIETQNTLNALAGVSNVEFEESSLKALIHALVKSTENKTNQLDLKVIKQDNPTTIQTKLNDNIKLDLNLNKPEEILSKFITLNIDKNDLKSPNLIPSDKFLTTDTNNSVKSITLNAETFKNMLSFIKSEFKQVIETSINNNATPADSKTLTQNNNNVQQTTNTLASPKVELPAIINTANKLAIPSLDSLTIKLPIALNNTEELPVRFSIETNPKTNQTEVLVKTGIQTINLENVDIELNSKAVNNYVNNMLQESSISLVNNNKILLKSPSMFEILLSVKNNLTDTSQVKFSLNDANNIVLKTPNNLQTSNTEFNLKNDINKQAIPHLGKHFAAQIAFMLTSVQAVNQAVKQADKDADIFTLLLDAVPDSYKPQLQASSNNADSLKYFTFPYYKEDDILDHGQLTYQQHENENGDDVHNIALKVEFSNIGEVMLKIKNINKNININIYTKRELNTTNKLAIETVAQQAIEKSGFLGTVSLKKSESMQMPLLNSAKMGYSGINLEV